MKLVVTGFGLIAVTAMAFAQNNTAVVTPANPQGWAFANEKVEGKSSGSFVDGPAGVPAGTGSAALATVDGDGAQVLGTGRYGNTKLADIATLRYSAIGNLTPAAIALQFDVDSDLTDATTTYQGRLVFEPYQGYGNGAVIPGQWSEWNTLDANKGKWWGSGSGPNRPVSNACPQSNPCTLTQLLNQFPNIGILANGGLFFKAGSGWTTAFSGNVDKLVIGIQDAQQTVSTTTWDFELHSTPSNKDQCKNGGYLLFNPPSGAYRNQGECISSVNN